GPVLPPDRPAVRRGTTVAYADRPRSVDRRRCSRWRHRAQRNRTHAPAARRAWRRWRELRRAYPCPTHQGSCISILAPAAYPGSAALALLFRQKHAIHFARDSVGHGRERPTVGQLTMASAVDRKSTRL